MVNQTKKSFEIKNLAQNHTHNSSVDQPVKADFGYKKTVKHNRILAIVTLTFFAFSLLTAGFYKGIQSVNKFFQNNELRFPKMIEVKFQAPIKVMTKEEIKKEQELNQKVDDIVNKALEIYYATPSATPSPKLKSAIVKPVEAKENRVYTNYSKKTHYATILAGIKTRFTNWEDAADLIAKEGMFDPAAINPTSGACGLGQALPCSKMKCALAPKGIDCQLDWIKDYVADRYGTVTNALNFRISNGWY